MNIAFLGCGYVAEQYANCLPFHRDLRLVGAFDQQPERLDGFARRLGCRKYLTLDDLLADTAVTLVVNLTNPRSHFDTNRQCLAQGKHVYSEKPLAMTTGEASSLVALASSRGLQLSSAPCSVLSETAQTLWRAVRENVVGPIRLVYANFDDGMIAPNLAPWHWTNDGGVPWPAKDEFEVGCTYQHAGYVVTWLCAMFGPALRVTSFASVQLPDKGIAVASMAPDFSVGCIEFADGVVARVTNGLVAPRDKSVSLVGDRGVLFVGNVRNDAAPVMVQRSGAGGWPSAIKRRAPWLRRWLEARLPSSSFEALSARAYPLARKPVGLAAAEGKPVDFLRGVADMADAIAEGRPCRLSAEFGAHLVEIVEALQYPEKFGYRKTMATTFSPIAPLPWAM